MIKTPQLLLYNRQRKIRLPLHQLQRQLEASLLLLPASTSRLPSVIEISFIGKTAMQKAHLDFLNDSSPTDVITFHHGEILICPEVAQEQGRQWSRTTAEETLLYGIHGLLHLLGWKDKTPQQFQKMRQAQEKIFTQVCQFP